MKINISYGADELPIELPTKTHVNILRPPDIPLLENPEKAVEDALFVPYGTKRLSELASGYKSAIILVTDYTRPLPYGTLLPPLLKELHSGGIQGGDISFLIASGTHRPMTPKEIDRHLGEEIAARYVIHPHKWMDSSCLMDYGTTPKGTPIQINRLMAGDALKIGIGTIKPHGDAGWSGGAKIILPGIAGFETTNAVHWLSSQYKSENIIGYDDTPVRKEMEDVAAKVGLDFIINCVQGIHHKLAYVTAGHFVEAHRAGTAFAKPWYTVPFEEEADLFISGSAEEQQSMWSQGSGPVWAETMLKRGGYMIHAGRCLNGVCAEHSDIEKYGYQPLEKLRKMVAQGEIMDLAAASHLQRGGEKIFDKDIRTFYYCEDLTAEQIARLGFEKIDDIQQAIDMVLKNCGKEPRIAVYPGHVFTALIPVKHPVESPARF